MQLKTQFKTVFDFVQSYDSLSGANARCLQRIFQVGIRMLQQQQAKPIACQWSTQKPWPSCAGTAATQQ
jgi:hypothetical protein